MQTGVSIFMTDFSIHPAEVARAVEERGFDALIFPEHTHIPASRQTPWPGGAELPKEYFHSLDPFVALTAAASATKRIQVGTGVCLVIERDPIVLAKEIASLDHLSGGRFVFGIGGGWNREEMADHGTEWKTRWSLLRERIEAMKALWSQDEASYHGTFVNFDRAWSWPKPVQKPHPPILVGGNGARTLERVVRYGDEWMPLWRGQGDFGERIKELQSLASAAGRKPIPVSMVGNASKPEQLEMHEASGISRVYFPVPPADRDTVLPRLDRLAELMREYNGR
jgi:probable F420-dependent oxidoreductase